MREHICIVSMVLAMAGTLGFVVGCNQQAAGQGRHEVGPKGTAHAADSRRMWT